MSDRETQPGSIIPGVDWESGVKRLMGNEQLYRKKKMYASNRVNAKN